MPTSHQSSQVQAALQLRQAGNLAGAIRLLYEALASNLSDVTVYATLASMLAEHGDFERADRVFQRAFDAGLDDPMLRLNHATFLAASGRSGGHVAEFRNAGHAMVTALATLARTNPAWALADTWNRWATAESNLARLRCAEGDLAAARDLAEKWLTVEHFWPSAHEVVQACMAEGEELVEFGRLYAAKRASPQMVAALFEQALDTDVVAALELVAASRAFLPWRWVADLEGLDDDLRGAVVEALTNGQLLPQGPTHQTLRWLLDGDQS